MNGIQQTAGGNVLELRRRTSTRVIEGSQGNASDTITPSTATGLPMGITLTHTALSSRTCIPTTPDQHTLALYEQLGLRAPTSTQPPSAPIRVHARQQSLKRKSDDITPVSDDITPVNDDITTVNDDVTTDDEEDLTPRPKKLQLKTNKKHDNSLALNSAADPSSLSLEASQSTSAADPSLSLEAGQSTSAADPSLSLEAGQRTSTAEALSGADPSSISPEERQNTSVAEALIELALPQSGAAILPQSGAAITPPFTGPETHPQSVEEQVKTIEKLRTELADAQQKLSALDTNHNKLRNKLNDYNFCADAAVRAFLMQELESGSDALRRKLSPRDIALDQQNLAVLSMEGRGGDQDFTKARELFEAACNEESVREDFSKDKNILGVMYEKGLGGDRDSTAAFKWFEKAAHQGHADAQNNLGAMYISGVVVPQDLKKACELFEKAAAQDHTIAQYHLGEMYRIGGEGVTQDPQKAIYLLEKAERKGYVPALVSLGMIYHDGQGVTKDHNKARKFFEKAVKKKHPIARKHAIAQFYLGLYMLEEDDGSSSVTRKQKEGYQLIKAAADQGYPAAQEAIKECPKFEKYLG